MTKKVVISVLGAIVTAFLLCCWLPNYLAWRGHQHPHYDYSCEFDVLPLFEAEESYFDTHGVLATSPEELGVTMKPNQRVEIQQFASGTKSFIITCATDGGAAWISTQTLSGYGWVKAAGVPWKGTPN